MSDAIGALSAVELAARIRGGELTARDVLQHFDKAIGQANESLNIFLARNDAAIEDADAIDAAVAKGKNPGLLAGVPIAVKDNIAVRGMPTTCGSKFLAGYASPFDATSVERLRAEGAIIIGKTNMDEFAMGSSTENSSAGPTRNPWDRNRAPGGSSGGSAAAVAAGMVPVAIGSDTGGSIRQPASFCSVTGFKPTYGTISRFGLVAFGSSLDQIGPITRSAEDAALVAQVMAGPDPRDATCSAVGPTEWSADARRGVEGLRIGVPLEYMGRGLDKPVRVEVERAIMTLKEAGAELVDIELPHTEHAIAVYYIIATSEASANLARYGSVGYGRRSERADSIDALYEMGRGEGLGDEVKRRIILGTWCLSSGYYDAYYDKASRVRTLISQDFDRAFADVDVICGPTSPCPPFKLGEKTTDPLAMYMADVYTVPASLAGLPGISVPAGFVEADGKRLPVGLQILAKRRNEAALFQTARALEGLTTHAKETPAS